MKIKAWVKTNMVGSKCEIEFDVDREDWEDMTEEERDDLVHDAIMNSGVIEWDYKVG
jgi:hypothetical protein